MDVIVETAAVAVLASVIASAIVWTHRAWVGWQARRAELEREARAARARRWAAARRFELARAARERKDRAA